MGIYLEIARQVITSHHTHRLPSSQLKDATDGDDDSYAASGRHPCHINGPDGLPGDWRVEWEERAAIKEFHGGMHRERAEAQALAEILDLMQKQTSYFNRDPNDPFDQS